MARWIFILSFFATGLPGSGFAQQVVDNVLWYGDPALSRLQDWEFGEIAEDLSIPTDVFGHCEMSIPEIYQLWKAGAAAEPYYACHSFKFNIDTDSMAIHTKPKALFTSQPLSLPRTVEGRVLYRAIVAKPYRYDVRLGSDGFYEIEVRVYFVGELGSNGLALAGMVEKFNEAGKLWSLRGTQWKMRFKFKVVGPNAKPHFQVRLSSGYGRGPYFWKFYSGWSYQTVAHEIGHMMGLNDEYSELGQFLLHHTDYYPSQEEADGCDQKSLMCSSGGDPQPYHFYLILRRIFAH